MHEIKSDREKNPRLAAELAHLRGSINHGAETRRFKRESHPERPAIIVTDTKTGRTTTVSLYAASATMDALAELFPE